MHRICLLVRLSAENTIIFVVDETHFLFMFSFINQTSYFFEFCRLVLRLFINDFAKVKLIAEQISNRKDDVQKRILESIDTALKWKAPDFESSNYAVISTLREAVALGMHEEPKVLVDYKNIPGLNFDVQKYITSLCKNYGVKTE